MGFRLELITSVTFIQCMIPSKFVLHVCKDEKIKAAGLFDQTISAGK
jgi:hypothetical protein